MMKRTLSSGGKRAGTLLAALCLAFCLLAGCAAPGANPGENATPTPPVTEAPAPAETPAPPEEGGTKPPLEETEPSLPGSGAPGTLPGAFRQEWSCTWPSRGKEGLPGPMKNRLRRHAAAGFFFGMLKLIPAY